MNDLRTTNWLLLCIALLLFNKFYPDTARTDWYIALGGLAIWAVFTFIKTWRRDEAERKQERKEIDRNLAFMAERDAIQRKYDPNNKWNEATSLPEAYRSEIEKLRSKYGIFD